VEIKVDFPHQAVIGQPIVANVKLSINGISSMKYAGLRLSAVRPCEKPLVIEQKEVFCQGSFAKGVYSREIPVFLPARLVPSSSERGIKYKIEFYSRIPVSTADDSSDQEYADAGEIVLVEERNKNKALEVNPVILAIKGFKLNLQKDIYRPGETIKINFEAKDLKELKIQLMERSNLLCNCTQFGRMCTQVPSIPPSTASASKVSNPTAGFMLLQIPKNAELSARHEWEPKDKTTWSDKFGDIKEWYLSVTGMRYSGEDINFEIPIEIGEGNIAGEKRENVQFFETSSSALKSEPGKQLFQIKKLKIVAVKTKAEGISISVKNDASTVFHGCTCRVTGLRDQFFETTPYMIGFSTIEPGAVMDLDAKLAKGITEINLEFDSNEGKLGTYRSSVSPM